jgi:serine/threonine protein kinase
MNVHEDEFDDEREVDILKSVQHQHVIQLLDAFWTEGFDEHLVIVLEYMSTDLATLLQSSSWHQGLIFDFTTHLVEALSYLSKQSIMHRDIKPSNLFIEGTTLKLGDFGQAIKYVPSQDYNHQVCSRWYRAPELLYGARNYDMSVDTWSAGCVIAEMILGRPLFAADSDIMQLVTVVNQLGSPNPETWPECELLPDYGKIRFKEAAARPWSDMFNGVVNVDGAIGVIITQVLPFVFVFNPKQRLTPDKIFSTISNASTVKR